MLSQIAEDSDEPNTNGGEYNIRKRRLDQLFGDIADLQDDDFEIDNLLSPFNLAKKVKTEEELDAEMIEQILQARAENQAKSLKPNGQNRLEQLENLRKFKAQNVSETYPKWPCTTVVNNNKDRLYVRMHSEDFERKQLGDLNFQQNYGNLLGESSKDIWDQAQQIVQKHMTNSSSQQPTATILTPALIDDTATLSSKDKLWVEKYRPKNYLDLLSDASTNRSLLTWLKMWDKAVFKREFKSTDNQSQGPSNFFNKRTGRFEMGFKKKVRKNDLQTEIDEFGRPVQRIAILCGPPGLGKTTLAHTIAQHAGYAVRELNASDDRSLDAFKLALQNGTQMQTAVLNPDRRPNCIILDEIDGAPSVSIEYLVRFVNEQTKEKGPNERGDKKGAKKALLRRPIICICNDIYTPALRQLRQMAFIVTFPSLESSRLADRLLFICRRERLKSDLGTLIALAEKSGNDIRSCISVLQFYANSNRPLTLSDVIKSNIGLKDKQRGLFEIWNSVFQIRKPRIKFEMQTDENDGNNVTEEACAPGEISTKIRMETVLDVVHSGGDYERLTTGVYENYLTQRMPDPNMLGISEATDWFCFSDRVQSQIQHKQIYTVYPYLQYGFVIWHLLFSSPRLPKIKFPIQGYEHSQKFGHQKLVRSTFLKKLSSGVRCVGSGPSVLLDTVSFLRHILSPSLRFVSLQLLTNKERLDLRHTVNVMVDLGLHYTQLRVADGTYQYQLEPDINILCHFDVPTNYTPLPYFNMQLIAREVDVEAMKRVMPKKSNNPELLSNISKGKAPSKFENHKQKLQPKIIPNNKKPAEVVSKDFFGRITARKPVTESQSREAEICKTRVWYHYKEGFNNAVRKDVTIRKLL